MSVYTWTDGITDFVYSYDDTQPTIKDQIRALIHDINGTPIAYLSDNAINATATAHNDDLYTSAAECAEQCAAACLQMHDEVQQGHRLKIKNFDPDKAFAAFMALANMLRNKSTIGNLPSYGTLAGKIQSCPPCPPGRPWGWP